MENTSGFQWYFKIIIRGGVISKKGKFRENSQREEGALKRKIPNFKLGILKTQGALNFCGAEQHQHVALSVCSFVSFVSFVKKNSCLNDQAYNCLIHFYSRLTWRHDIWRHEIWRHEIGRHEIWRHEIWRQEI